MFDENEMFNGISPDPDNVVCKSCKLALKGANEFDGEPYYCKTNCGHYGRNSHKPIGVLTSGDPCEYKVDGIPSVDQNDVIDFE